MTSSQTIRTKHAFDFLWIEKINPELPASISNVGVKACIEGKQKASFK
jgi:hypothetical protein